MKRLFLVWSSDSYLPKAKVCVDSIKKFHPEAEVELIKLGAMTGYISTKLTKDRLIAARREINNGYDEVIILGADCVLYDRIDCFLDMPGTVLQLHTVKPPVNPAALYKTGHVNADMVLYRKCSLPLLDWLIAQDIKEEVHNGSFHDQTLLSAAVFFFDDISVCKDPGINFAYFNFYERTLTKENGKYFVNGVPLKVAHFSGFIKAEHGPNKVSKYYNGPVTDTVMELFREYESQVK